jgi:hypothetical protein
MTLYEPVSGQRFQSMVYTALYRPRQASTALFLSSLNSISLESVSDMSRASSTFLSDLGRRDAFPGAGRRIAMIGAKRGCRASAGHVARRPATARP